jgi:GNAT superfamily N-acetyltransferase
VALIVAALDKAVHDRTAFDCGELALNDFLRTKAARHQTQRISRTFVLVEGAHPGAIVGYYTLSNCQIAREQLAEQEARTLPLHPIPAVMLGRLAVDLARQGRHFGEWLLMDALKRCALVGQQSGVYALLVDATNEKVARFYKRFGFSAIAGRPLTLYLPLETAIRAMRDV